MGRKVGVTSEQTRAELLIAAAEIFAQKGYDGASISDITRESGLSSGAIYSHYGSKAGLFFAVVEERGRQEFTDLVGADHLDTYSELNQHVADISEFLTLAGAALDIESPIDSPLMVEAIVASKQHAEVAELVSTWFVDGEGLIADTIRDEQESGTLAADVDAEAVARLTTFLTLGARIAGVMDLPDVDRDGWSSLISRLVGSLRPEPVDQSAT
jgi:AcrR family transcriptional regulator